MRVETHMAQFCSHWLQLAMSAPDEKDFVNYLLAVMQMMLQMPAAMKAWGRSRRFCLLAKNIGCSHVKHRTLFMQ